MKMPMALLALMMVPLLALSAHAESETVTTDEGTLDIKLSYNTITAGAQTTLNIEFISPETGGVQEHIDYYIHVSKDGESAYGPTDRTHNDEGVIDVPVTFDHEGEYTVEVTVDGIQFELVPEDSASFVVTALEGVDSVEVRIDYDDEIVPGKQATLRIDFVNEAGDIQEHIDYMVHVSKDGESAYGPTDRRHTDEGYVEVPVSFDQGEGVYTVDVTVDGILFVALPETTTTFGLLAAEKSGDLMMMDDGEQMSSTNRGIDVELTHGKLAPGEQSNIGISFINAATDSVQEHIDYYVHVSKDGESVFGPTNRIHTSEGEVEIPVYFDQEGEYAVDITIDGILFAPVEEDSVSFMVMASAESMMDGDMMDRMDDDSMMDGDGMMMMEESQMLKTVDGTIDIRISHEELIAGEQATINVDFVNESGGIQEHIDYYIHVSKDGESAYGPTDRRHTDEGYVEVPVSFDQGEGEYTVDVTIDGILFEAVPEDSVSFMVMAQSESMMDDGDQADGGGCLIATAAYGTELAPQVQQLRELRDNVVMSTESGASFMTGFNDFYYSFSPAIADLEREHPAFKEVVKVSLTPLVSSLSLLNHVGIDSESEMIGYGVSLIILNLAMYAGVPALGIVMLARHKRN